MNRQGLTAYVAAAGLCTKKVAEDAINAVLAGIEDALVKEEELQLTGFGRFIVNTRAPRKGINPKTQESIDIPETKVISFKAGEKLKTAVANGGKKKKGIKKIVKK